MTLKSSHIIQVQQKITERALELLALSAGSKFLLDIGCGSGLSGDALSDSDHKWVGIDISKSMLDVSLERGVEGDLFLWDAGHGITFRPGVFDGAVSISAIQWLCNADKKSDNPISRIKRFFNTLYNTLSRGARAVLQAYPQDAEQMELLASSAMRAGFGGGWLVDYPNSTRAKKFYLVLFAGVTSSLPAALDDEDEQTENIQAFKWEERRKNIKKTRLSTKKGGREWILAKKERQRKQGKDVRPDSKYTGRKRKNMKNG